MSTVWVAKWGNSDVISKDESEGGPPEPSDDRLTITLMVTQRIPVPGILWWHNYRQTPCYEVRGRGNNLVGDVDPKGVGLSALRARMLTMRKGE